MKSRQTIMLAKLLLPAIADAAMPLEDVSREISQCWDLPNKTTSAQSIIGWYGFGKEGPRNTAEHIGDVEGEQNHRVSAVTAV